MAKRWMNLVLAASCLAWSATALAQSPAPATEGMPIPQPPPNAPPIFCPAPAAGPTAGILGPVFDQGDCGSQGPVTSFNFEYLLWYALEQRVPTLVTRGPSTDPIPGAKNQPGTKDLVNRIDANPTAGTRLTLGIGLDSSSDWSFEAGALLFGQSTFRRHYQSSGEAGSQVLARPFFNAVSKVEDSDPAAFPLLASGSIDVQSVRHLQGYDGIFRFLYLTDPDSRLVLLTGFGFRDLQEGLSMEVHSQDLPGQGAPGNTYFLSEAFGTRNTFYGAEFGCDYEYHLGPVFFKAVCKVGVGVVNQTVTRNPFIQITEPNGIVTSSNDRALYISPANAGHFSRTQLCAVPEGTFKIGYDFNQNVQVTVGYSFLYFANAVRPGDQIDRNVIVQPVGTSATFVSRGEPQQFHATDFFAQGLTVGLRLSF